jgi:hypothetical protein
MLMLIYQPFTKAPTCKRRLAMGGFSYTCESYLLNDRYIPLVLLLALAPLL